MVIILRILIFFIFSCLLFSQGKEIHYYELKHISATEVLPYIEKMISPYGDIRYQPIKNAIQVSDFPENLKKIQDFIKNNDIPPQKYKIIIKLMEASHSIEREESISDSENIKSKLKRIAPFKNYKFLDELSIEAEPGAFINQVIFKDYQISFILKRVIGNQNFVKFLDLEFSKIEMVNKNVKTINPILKTSLNIALGRTQVLAASPSFNEKKALIFVFFVEKK